VVVQEVLISWAFAMHPDRCRARTRASRSVDAETPPARRSATPVRSSWSIAHKWLQVARSQQRVVSRPNVPGAPRQRVGVSRVVRFSAEGVLVGAEPVQSGRGESVAARSSGAGVIKRDAQRSLQLCRGCCELASMQPCACGSWPLPATAGRMARHSPSASGAGFRCRAPAAALGVPIRLPMQPPQAFGAWAVGRKVFHPGRRRPVDQPGSSQSIREGKRAKAARLSLHAVGPGQNLLQGCLSKAAIRISPPAGCRHRPVPIGAADPETAQPRKSAARNNAPQACSTRAITKLRIARRCGASALVVAIGRSHGSRGFDHQPRLPAASCSAEGLNQSRCS